MGFFGGFELEHDTFHVRSNYVPLRRGGDGADHQLEGVQPQLQHQHRRLLRDRQPTLQSNTGWDALLPAVLRAV